MANVLTVELTDRERELLETLTAEGGCPSPDVTIRRMLWRRYEQTHPNEDLLPDILRNAAEVAGRDR